MILTESGVNPDKVTISQFTQQDRRPRARSSLDAYMTVGPLDSKVTGCDHRDGGRARAGVPPHRLSEAIAQTSATSPRDRRQHLLVVAGPPEDKVETVGVNH